MTDREWVEAFARAMGTEPPDDAEFAALLELAGVAAHASQRTAAPVSCWLAARAGVAPADALTRARALAEEAG